jgi:hypothetical protein
MTNFEKLGAFYLGRAYDADSGEVGSEPILYDSKDLTTHAVCVGMTGSGKTGLGVALLEEAIIDGIPVIAIDPKGDLGNMLLTFPNLSASDFAPWVDPGEAARKGRSPEEQASATAAMWKKGLADWGQNGKRIKLYRDAAEPCIYTPGSNAGAQISLLQSFAAPPAALLEDGDAMRERVSASVSGLLALLGIDADPIRSREHILLSMMIDRAWREGRDLDLPSLIRGIGEPPFDRVGVFDLESFFPSSERFELAMTLNNLVASPSFAAWSEGEPLSIPNLLHTADGRPKLSILSIAHLSDAERMFFVTSVLTELIAWMRSQPGTQSLRAILYMDEVFGYFPPTANPPSKTPMLTLLKQARAYGLGCVLATQNPVDLDYKGLANAGTWFLGRLQTERDKARVIDGLEGAAATTGAGFDRAKIERTLSGMQSRVFLMNNVHEDEPVLFHTRWVLNYLAGPLTREQIARLYEPTLKGPARKKAAKKANAKAAASAAEAIPPKAEEAGDNRPSLPPEIDEQFMAITRVGSRDNRIVYRPALFARTTLHFSSAKMDVDNWQRPNLLARLIGDASGDLWEEHTEIASAPELLAAPEMGATFADLPAAAMQKKRYATWSKQLKSQLYRERRLRLYKCKALKASSKPGDSEGDFRARMRELAREKRDMAVEKLRAKYAPKLARLQDQLRTAEERIEREQDQYQHRKMDTAISIGSTVLGALFGRKLASSSTVSSAGTAMRGVGRANRERGDIARAQERHRVLTDKLADLEVEFEEKLTDLRDSCEPDQFECTQVAIKPTKTDLSIDRLSLVWTPWRIDADGIATPAY